VRYFIYKLQQPDTEPHHNFATDTNISRSHTNICANGGAAKNQYTRADAAIQFELARLRAETTFGVGYDDRTRHDAR
jgi:hypothetical protein